MPRAKRRCAKSDCRNFQPCSTHPRGWASSKSPLLPTNWGSLTKAIKRRSGGRCEYQMFGIRCTRPGHSVDHIVPRSEGGSHKTTNLQHLCYEHHKVKTDAERKRGSQRGRYA